MTLDKSSGAYLLVFERTRTGYSMYAPDLPGCAATGWTMEQTKRLMYGAIMIHQRGMREDGLRVPRPRSLAELRRKAAATNEIRVRDLPMPSKPTSTIHDGS